MAEQKKTLFHSEFVTLGTVRVTVKSDILKSRFKNQTDYVILHLNGRDRNYALDTPECAAFFEGQNGRTFYMIAEGSTKDGSAMLTYVGENMPGEPDNPPPPAQSPVSAPPRAAIRPPARPVTPAAPKSPPANPTPTASAQTTPPPAPVELGKVKEQANRLANLWLISYEAGLFARREAIARQNPDLTEEQFQAAVSSIFIQLARDGMQNKMPTGHLPPKPTPPAQPQSAPAMQPASREEAAAAADDYL